MNTAKIHAHSQGPGHHQIGEVVHSAVTSLLRRPPSLTAQAARSPHFQEVLRSEVSLNWIPAKERGLTARQRAEAANAAYRALHGVE